MILFRLLLLFLCSTIAAEERFLLIDGTSGKTLLELGSQLDERLSPCSTFKIPLSLMGYDAGILEDEYNPVWFFQEGYDDFLDTWKTPQSPQSWMQHSCIWYSKLLSCHLGLTRMQTYLAAFAYGNQDLSWGIVQPGEIDPAWLPSAPLKISPKEQVEFIRSMLQHKLGITRDATHKTKALLFKEDLPQGGKLFGKTGGSGLSQCPGQHAWFVGWLERGEHVFPFAYVIIDQTIALDQRIPRVKQLIAEADLKNLLFVP
jgi:beta-lactamase class D